jgi:hypothetical protein
MKIVVADDGSDRAKRALERAAERDSCSWSPPPSRTRQAHAARICQLEGREPRACDVLVAR